MEKLDYKKMYRDLYLPKREVSLVTVPPIPFFAVKGSGLPGSAPFQSAIACLYAFAFTIKMSKLGGACPPGYFEYVVPPLEALWGTQERPFRYEDKSTWVWTMLLRQPDFVTPALAEQTREQLRKKKPELSVDGVSFLTFEEGPCAQILHIGRYEDEAATLAVLEKALAEKGLARRGLHHELYLSDPRRTKPEKCKTILRVPVASL